MLKRTLSNTGLEVSELGLGCMGMSDFYGPIDKAEAIKTLEIAVELGITHFDTADMYGYGENEELVGSTLKKHRDKLVVATKFGIVRDKNDPMVRGINGHPDYVKQACDASLKRLGMDFIDLFYAHRIDPTVPIEETIGALANLVHQGKIRYIGLSEASSEIIKRAHAVHPLTAIQSEFSLWCREPATEILPLCEFLGIGFVAYSPMGRGFLTGKMKTIDVLDPTDFRRNQPRLQGDNLTHNLKLVEALEKFAKAKNCTPAQLCLAWVLAQGEYVTAIPGTKHRTYLEENVKALSVKLTPKDIADLDDAFPIGSAKGERYPPAAMTSLALKE